ncbi:MAG: hypothetical protein IMF18_01415 [Proteobacteria bacterium]|nr:hypothetical protein [Pseudomonadota bacterium]
MLEKVKSTGLILLAFSIVCLALAIVYFTYEAQSWRKDLPGILQLTGETADKLAPPIAEVADVAKLIPPIVEEVAKAREVIRELVKEVEATREALPGILKDVEPITRQMENTTVQLPKVIDPVLGEVSKTRETIPGILQEVREMNATIQKALVEVRETRNEIPAIVRNVEAIHRDMPTWLETIDRAAEAIQKISAESGEMRVLIPDILAEVKRVREELPGIMDRADNIVANAKDVGKEAGKGAVSGMVGGIVSAPFNLVRGSADAVTSVYKSFGRDFTEKDMAIIRESLKPLLEAEREGHTVDWNNPESGNEGKITLEKIYEENGQECRQVRHELWIKGKKTRDVIQKGCRQSDGTWIETDRSVSGK